MRNYAPPKRQNVVFLKKNTSVINPNGGTIIHMSRNHRTNVVISIWQKHYEVKEWKSPKTGFWNPK